MKTKINITEGTEKEIKRAESIRDEAFKFLKKRFEKMESRGKEDRAKLYRQKIENIKNHPNNHKADFWIRNNDIISGLNVMELS
ncbi:MAG: hypothetical protein ACLFUH_01815 [Bacteroidales bacterium]